MKTELKLTSTPELFTKDGKCKLSTEVDAVDINGKKYIVIFDIHIEFFDKMEDEKWIRKNSIIIWDQFEVYINKNTRNCTEKSFTLVDNFGEAK